MHSDDKKYRFFFETSADAMLIIENGEFVDCNAATVKMLGYGSKEEVINKTPFELSPEYQPDGRPSAEKAIEMINLALRQGSHRFEWDHQNNDGDVIPIEVTLTAIKNNGDTHIHTVWRDITERKKAQLELVESEELFRLTFEANPDPVILARLADGSIFDVNRAFELATGFSREEALGKNSEELGFWSEPRMRDEFRHQLLSKGEVNNLDADFLVKDGSYRSALLSAKVIKVTDQPSMLVSIRDISENKAAERSLRELDRQKSDFISMAAHELKTPLTAIMGFAELLYHADSSHKLTEEAKRDFLNEIINRGEVLDRMIRDFLDLSRIESGIPLPLELAETDLVDILSKSVDFFRRSSPGHQFELRMPGEQVSLLLNVDRHRITQVIENLLGNSVKYSEPGTKIEVELNILDRGCEVSVIDAGIGMTPDQVNNVFNKFYRADENRPNVPGLGLGMSIVKSIIDAHGGAVSVTSTAGQGTKVTFNLTD